MPCCGSDSHFLYFQRALSLFVFVHERRTPKTKTKRQNQLCVKPEAKNASEKTRYRSFFHSQKKRTPKSKDNDFIHNINSFLAALLAALMMRPDGAELWAHIFHREPYLARLCPIVFYSRPPENLYLEAPDQEINRRASHFIEPSGAPFQHNFR